MEKQNLIELKKRILALGMAGIMVGVAGCKNNKDNEIPEIKEIPSICSFYEADNYYVYGVRNNEVTKLYKSENVYLFFDKATFEVGEGFGTKYFSIFDMVTEKQIFQRGYVIFNYNAEYYDYLLENYYVVYLNDLSRYVEGEEAKKYYSLEEIRELEPKIIEGLKIIYGANDNILIRK